MILLLAMLTVTQAMQKLTALSGDWGAVQVRVIAGGKAVELDGEKSAKIFRLDDDAMSCPIFTSDGDEERLHSVELEESYFLFDHGYKLEFHRDGSFWEVQVDDDNVSSAAFTRANPEREIRKVTEAFFDAWNRNDIPALVSHWTSDATVVDPGGEGAHGSAELLSFFARRHEQAGRTTEKLTALKVRPLGSDLAFADVEMTINGKIPFHFAGVLRKDRGEWKWLEGRPYPVPTQ